MSKKSAKIAELIRDGSEAGLDPHYSGYFACFNRGWFYEAHDVLEELWLEDRQGANGDFYKGLIQLAGAFVHLSKQRPRPAVALFGLAYRNLAKYPTRHERLAVDEVLGFIDAWRARLEAPGADPDLLTSSPAPQLRLLPG